MLRTECRVCLGSQGEPTGPGRNQVSRPRFPQQLRPPHNPPTNQKPRPHQERTLHAPARCSASDHRGAGSPPAAPPGCPPGAPPKREQRVFGFRVVNPKHMAMQEARRSASVERAQAASGAASARHSQALGGSSSRRQCSSSRPPSAAARRCQSGARRPRRCAAAGWGAAAGRRPPSPAARTTPARPSTPTHGSGEAGGLRHELS